MSYIPRTPFRRAVDIGLVKQLAIAGQTPTGTTVSKWDVLRDLAVAKQHYGLSDRSLTVLQALLSFHPKTELADTGAPLVVFPSNAALCERLHGMPCSTMRRHLAHLVSAGLLLRRDSPNGKRFVKRRGQAPQAFGFDLGPLTRLAREIGSQADRSRAENAQVEQLRQSIILMRRDLENFVAYGRETAADALPWDAFSDLCLLTARNLRRKLKMPELKEIEAQFTEALKDVEEALLPNETDELGTKDSHSEHHHQKSDKEKIKSIADPRLEPPRLSDVLNLCTEINAYATVPINDWQALNRTAETIAPMIGIDKVTWFTAVNLIGPINASVAVSVILQRLAKIRNPGAYLNHLTTKSRHGLFTIHALLKTLQTPQIGKSSQL